METTIVQWCYIGIMENTMKTTTIRRGRRPRAFRTRAVEMEVPPKLNRFWMGVWGGLGGACSVLSPLCSLCRGGLALAVKLL